MIDIIQVKKNLENILNRNVDEEMLNVLKKLCNYSAEKEFNHLSMLINLLKVEGKGSAESVFVITSLMKVKEFLTYFINEPGLSKPASREPVSYEKYIDWFLSNRNGKKIKNQNLTLLEVNIQTPLKLSGKIFTEWLEVGMDECGDFRHYVADITK